MEKQLKELIKDESLLKIITDENNKMELREFDNGTKRYILEFELEGYQCEIIRHPELGHLCGYVVLKQSDYVSDDMFDYYFDVHGGITYVDSKELKIGFDCAHCMDKSPFMETFGYDLGGVYRNLEFVKNEIEYLVSQIINNKEE